MANYSEPDLNQIRKYFPETSGTYLPSIFPLGYFVRRNEPRLLYVTPLTMIYEGKHYTVKSRNMSANGLQIYLPRTFIMDGKTVLLTFDKFRDKHNNMLGGVDEFTNFENIEYVIRDVQHTGEKTYVSLVQKDLSQPTRDFFQRFIAGNRLRYKIDATDRIFASKAQYYENLYTINMQHVPIFIRWNKHIGFHIDTVVKTECNGDFFNYLSDEKGFPDFRLFCLTSRIEKFAELARKGESAILFSYYENPSDKSSLNSIFDFEIQNCHDMAHILARVLNHKGRIYKASTNLNKKPSAEKITSMLSKIQKIDSKASSEIDRRAQESIAQVIFSDITQIYSRQAFFSLPLNFDSGKPVSIPVLRGNCLVRMADGQLIKTIDENSFHQPDIIQFSIGHNRYDPRYQYEMDVSIRYNNQTYSAKTLDFSRSGLGLVIKQLVEIEEGSDIEITFSSLLIKGISTQLKDISHKVMISRRTNDGLFLGVIRNNSACHPEINRFFTRLVNRNKVKLELCIKDKVDYVSTIFFEAFVNENIQTIPVVITRDRNNHHYIRDIGLNEPPCPLADKLYIKGHGYDFRFLTTPLRLEQLHQRAIKASEKNRQSFMLYFFKAKNEAGIESIFSITDFELIRDEQLEAMIKIVLQNHGACVRVQFINNLLIDKLYQNMTIDKVESLNKASARILAQEYKEIIGFAEMLDLTDVYRKQYKFRLETL